MTWATKIATCALLAALTSVGAGACVAEELGDRHAEPDGREWLEQEWASSLTPAEERDLCNGIADIGTGATHELLLDIIDEQRLGVTVSRSEFDEFTTETCR